VWRDSEGHADHGHRACTRRTCIGSNASAGGRQREVPHDTSSFDTPATRLHALDPAVLSCLSLQMPRPAQRHCLRGASGAGRGDHADQPTGSTRPVAPPPTLPSGCSRVSILIVPAHPFHRIFEAALIAAFRHEVEVMIGTIEHVNAPRIAGIGVKHLVFLIPVEDADANLF
jgi:hypothetical protein